MTTTSSVSGRSLATVARESFFPSLREPLSASPQLLGFLPTPRFWKNWEHRWLALPITFPLMLAFAVMLSMVPGMLEWPIFTALLCVGWGQVSHGIVETWMRNTQQKREMLSPAQEPSAALGDGR